MRDQIRELWTQVNLLKRLTQRVPLRDVATANTARTFIVLGGNTLGTVSAVVYTGIKPLGTSITAVPVAVPINGATYADGLGYGQLVVNGVATGALVWIASKATPASGGAAVQEYRNYMIANAYVTSRQSVSVTCTAGGTARVYIPFEV